MRIAIDPQGEDPLDHIYLQGLPDDGNETVPYSCGPPNQDNTGAKYHEYVLIAIEGDEIRTKTLKIRMLEIPT